MILSLVFLLCFTFACQDKEAISELEAIKAQAGVEEQNKEIVRRYFEAFDKQDVDTISELITPDGVCYIPGIQKGFPLTAFIPAMKSHREAFPDSTNDIKAVIAEGDIVAVRLTEISTHEGEYDGIPPTGNKIYVENQFWLRLVNGKITEVWLLEDTFGKMQQLGMELRPKEK